MDENLYDETGSLLLFNKATQEDIDLLLMLVARGKFAYVDLLRQVIDNDEALIKLFDVMAGLKVQFPDRRKIYKTLEKVFIYNYCKKREFSEQSLYVMAKQYNKRVSQIKTIIATMEKFLKAENNKDFTDEEIDEL